MDEALLKVISHLEKLTPYAFDALVANAVAEARFNLALGILGTCMSAYSIKRFRSLADIYENENERALLAVLAIFGTVLAPIALREAFVCLSSPAGYVLSNLLQRN